MTELSKRINRVTSARRHEAGRTRLVIVSFAPPAEVGARLQGTKQTFWLTAEEIYELGVRKYIRQVEALALKIKKAEGCRITTARAKARKQVKAEQV